MSSTPEPLKELGRERAEHLRRLATIANSAHSAARGAAGAAIAHVLAAGNALARARDLCEDGEWGGWMKRNFEGSLRTAQRYVRAARRFPEQIGHATRVSHDSQAAAMSALRRLLFGTPKQRSRDALFHMISDGAAERSTAEAPTIASRERGTCPAEFAELAIRRLRLIADELQPLVPGDDARSAAIVASIRGLADELQLDGSGVSAAAGTRVYFIEAVGADRIKIGIAADPEARLAQLQSASPLPLQLVGTIAGDRDVERALHSRFASFRLAGEWFHLASHVRQSIDRILNGAPV